MNVEVTAGEGCHIATVSGRVDGLSAGEFETEIKNLIAGGGNCILLDMSQLEYINSAGIRSILLLAKSLRAVKGRMCFTGMQPSVEEVFDISGFKSMFAIFSSREEALAAGIAAWR